MNIIQAHHTGLPIRRSGWKAYFRLEIEGDLVSIVSGETLRPDRLDILANDWEVMTNNRVEPFSMDSVWLSSPTLRSVYGVD